MTMMALKTSMWSMVIYIHRLIRPKQRWDIFKQILLYRNLGSGRFLNVSSLLGHGKHVGRGAGFGDLDNDGRVDVVISTWMASLMC